MYAQTKIIELLIAALPYPEKIKNINLSRPNEVRFEWRGNAFAVSDTLNTEQIDGAFLVGSDLAILLKALLEKAAQ